MAGLPWEFPGKPWHAPLILTSNNRAPTTRQWIRTRLSSLGYIGCSLESITITVHISESDPLGLYSLCAVGRMPKSLFGALMHEQIQREDLSTCYAIKPAA